MKCCGCSCEQNKIEDIQDEDMLEQLYWEFDHQRAKSGEERLNFKGKLRTYGIYLQQMLQSQQFKCCGQK